MCECGLEKKAEDILILDMRSCAAFCDTFVVMGAASTARVKTIVEFIEESMEEHGLRAKHKEGAGEGLWVLMDYEEVVVHIFHHDTRRFYGLEYLWGDAPRRPYVWHDEQAKGKS